MAHRQRPPQYAHSFIDSCAFNPGGIEEAASRRILEKWPNIIVAHSVQKELDHPNTPEDVKRMARAFVYTIETALTPELLNKKIEIRVLIQGNANPGRHRGDADHLFELYKYGGGYFVTTDARLLSRTDISSNFKTVLLGPPPEYKQLDKKIGTVQWHPATSSYSDYPSYHIVTVNGTVELVEHKKMEPIFYISDDPEMHKILEKSGS